MLETFFILLAVIGAGLFLAVLLVIAVLFVSAICEKFQAAIGENEAARNEWIGRSWKRWGAQTNRDFYRRG
jgi:hypothetical protein